MGKTVGLARGQSTIGHHPLKSFTADELRADIRLILCDQSFAKAARHWQSVYRNQRGGSGYAAELIEGFAQNGHCQFGVVTQASPLHRAAPQEEDLGSVAMVGFAASIVAFAEDPAPLTFEDDESDDDCNKLPRGVRLEQMLTQSAALFGWQHIMTEWLLRLRVYRDFTRFCASGPGVIRLLDLADVQEFVQAAGSVHDALLRRGIPLGLVSPALHGEPHRPEGLTCGLLANAEILGQRLNEVDTHADASKSSTAYPAKSEALASCGPGGPAASAAEGNADITDSDVTTLLEGLLGALGESVARVPAGASVGAEPACQDSSFDVLERLLSSARQAIKSPWWASLSDP